MICNVPFFVNKDCHYDQHIYIYIPTFQSTDVLFCSSSWNEGKERERKIMRGSPMLERGPEDGILFSSGP